jgi:hypothetical protein
MINQLNLLYFRSSKDVNLRGATRWHFDYKVKDIIRILDIVF